MVALVLVGLKPILAFHVFLLSFNTFLCKLGSLLLPQETHLLILFLFNGTLLLIDKKNKYGVAPVEFKMRKKYIRWFGYVYRRLEQTVSDAA